MSSVESWSTTAASNNAAPPDGFPEGQTPASLNNSAREVMAAVATLVRQLPWLKLSTGLTLARNSATQFQATGVDVTSIYTVGRRLREIGSTTVYGRVSASNFSGGNTLVDVINDAAAAIPTSLTSVDVADSDANSSLVTVSQIPDYRGWELIADKSGTGLSSIEFKDLAQGNYAKLHLYLNLTGSSSSFQNILFRTDFNNGSSYDSGTSDYYELSDYCQLTIGGGSSTFSTGSPNGTSVGSFANGAVTSTSGDYLSASIDIDLGSASRYPKFNGYYSSLLTVPPTVSLTTGTLCFHRAAVGTMNAFIIIPSTGTMSGTCALWGIRRA